MTLDAPAITLSRIGPDYTRMNELLDLIRRSFAYMDGQIDPPSSVHQLSLAKLREKCAMEIAIIAMQAETMLGCVFLAEKDDRFYLGKLAIDSGRQGRGIGSMLVKEAEKTAISQGKPTLELQVRVELTGNHAAFSRLGFTEVGRTAHAGFAQPTSITMRKSLSALDA